MPESDEKQKSNKNNVLHSTLSLTEPSLCIGHLRSTMHHTFAKTLAYVLQQDDGVIVLQLYAPV